MITVLYVDVNGLHEINNLPGHQKGDDMLCCVADTLKNYFPEERVYRIGGDEFVMLSSRLNEASVERIVQEVRMTLSRNNYSISVGAASGDSAAVYNTVGAAELAMRRDKSEYYKDGQNDRKTRTMNEELEQMLTEKQDEEYFLSLISSKYAGVYYVDILRDTIRYIYIPDFFKKMLQNSSFSFFRAIKLYARKYVKQEYYEGFSKLTDPEYLISSMKNGQTIIYEYCKVDMVRMKLKISMSPDTGNGKCETVWIFTEDD